VARLRLGVVLLVPPPLSGPIDGLRRAFGDPVLEQVAPHVTLVPPVNVAIGDLPEALARMREAAAEVRPLELRLGPVVAFPGHEHVAYLEVRGQDDRALESLHRLQRHVFRPPLERTIDHDFVPHVTVTQGVDAARLAAVLEAARSWEDQPARFERIHLLDEQHPSEGKRWVPVADVELGPRSIVGRGGLELELTPSELVDPEAAAAAGIGESARPPDTGVAWPRPLVVAARCEGEVVGLARGATDGRTDAAPSDVWVRAGHEDLVDPHLRAAWRLGAARRLADETAD
jgi:2'-5' RNA ligase